MTSFLPLTQLFGRGLLGKTLSPLRQIFLEASQGAIGAHIALTATALMLKGVLFFCGPMMDRQFMLANFLSISLSGSLAKNALWPSA
jgi:hypothetical protein